MKTNTTKEASNESKGDADIVIDEGDTDNVDWRNADLDRADH